MRHSWIGGFHGILLAMLAMPAVPAGAASAQDVTLEPGSGPVVRSPGDSPRESAHSDIQADALENQPAPSTDVAGYRLTVAQAISLAIERNPSLQRTRLNVLLAELAEHRAKLDRITASVDVRAGYLADVSWDPSTNIADQDLLGHTTDYGTSALLSVPLYAGGLTAARVKQSEVAVDVSKSDLAVAERELERAAYQAYWTIQGYELQQQAAREGLEQSRQAVEIIQAKVDTGLAAPIELNRFKVDVLNQEQRLAQLELAAYSARQTLARLLHLDGRAIELADRAEDVQLGPWPDDAGELVARAASRRPELAGLALSRTAAQYDRKMARAGYFPAISLDITLDAGNTALWTDADTLDQASFSPTVEVTGGVNLSWNLFNNFSTRYQVERAETIIEQWRQQEAAEYDAIAEEVRTALETWKNLERRAAGVKAQVELATENLMILQTLYNQGSASLLDLLNAQSEYRTALSQAASFQVDVVTAEYDLRWSVGESPAR